jgi:hypothetical protein
MYLREKTYIHCLWGSLRERDDLEDSRIYGIIILKWLLVKWVRVKDWLDLAQNRESWRPVLDVVMKFRVPQNAENFFGILVAVSLSERRILHGVSHEYTNLVQIGGKNYLGTLHEDLFTFYCCRRQICHSSIFV